MTGGIYLFLMRLESCRDFDTTQLLRIYLCDSRDIRSCCRDLHQLLRAFCETPSII
jgi:hypothetical protein